MYTLNVCVYFTYYKNEKNNGKMNALTHIL